MKKDLEVLEIDKILSPFFRKAIDIKMKTSGINIEEFIKNHKKINYCEAILYSDGTIEYANPSHTYKLCNIYDDTKSIKEIEYSIPLNQSPLTWLLCKCNCIGIWYNFFKLDTRYKKITEKQKESLRLLNEKGITNIENLEKLFEECEKDYLDFNKYLKENFSEDKITKIYENLDIWLGWGE